MVHPLIKFVLIAIEIVHYIVLVYLILDILIKFKVINFQNPLVMRIYVGLQSYIDPVLQRIRRFIPVKGGLDLSPIILLVGLYFLSYTITYYAI